jgi:hypothetical protein
MYLYTTKAPSVDQIDKGQHFFLAAVVSAGQYGLSGAIVGGPRTFLRIRQVAVSRLCQRAQGCAHPTS